MSSLLQDETKTGRRLSSSSSFCFCISKPRRLCPGKLRTAVWNGNVGVTDSRFHVSRFTRTWDVAADDEERADEEEAEGGDESATPQEHAAAQSRGPPKQRAARRRSSPGAGAGAASGVGSSGGGADVRDADDLLEQRQVRFRKLSSVFSTALPTCPKR
jgi:hypothetical protein